MCYTLNNGSCLRSGQAVVSQAPARQGGSAAGFVSLVRKRKTGAEGRLCERDALNVKKQSEQKMCLCCQLSLPESQSSCSLARQQATAGWQLAWGGAGPSSSCARRQRCQHTALCPQVAMWLDFGCGCVENTGPFGDHHAGAITSSPVLLRGTSHRAQGETCQSRAGTVAPPTWGCLHVCPCADTAWPRKALWKNTQGAQAARTKCLTLPLIHCRWTALTAVTLDGYV